MPSPAARPRMVLICHHDAPLDNDGLVRWLASFTDLVGVVVLKEAPAAVKARIKREWARSGTAGMLDVMAFRVAYRLTSAAADAAWETAELRALQARYPAASPPTIVAPNPNTPEVEAFLRSVAPDLMIARCKFLLKRRIFEIPRNGTYVLHPGICPEYRNAHGGFWALANGDYGRVGATLLRVDPGVDTGPVFAFYSYPYDPLAESHIRIQSRCVLENLDAIGAKLLEINAGTAQTIDTTGRASAVWGQPHLSAQLKLRRLARTRS
jgi:folate-dependent phosphoribosylglycinamide formyltransferase PurN